MYLYTDLPLHTNKSVNKKESTDSIIPEILQSPPKTIKILVTEILGCNMFG